MNRHLRNYAVLAILLVVLFPMRAMAQGAGYWHTSGNQILDGNGQPVRIAGINWYGFETTDMIAHGLWARDYKSILDAIKANGYNVVRIPLSNQMVEQPVIPSNISYFSGGVPINTDLQNLNSMQILDHVVSYAGSIGLRLILDNHRSEAGNSAEDNGLWYTSEYPENAWLNDWVTLAERYLGNTTIIGFDLRNEPHNANSGGACWDCGGNNDWHLAAERAGNAVLAINPHQLIAVEGTDCYNGSCYWWGGNLAGARNSPVVLNVPGQLIYSAHDYGPNLFAQSWFNSGTTAASLKSEWTNTWAYLGLDGIAPVWLGEFGTTNNPIDIQNSVAGSQGQWFETLIQFLHDNSRLEWTYWALNGEDSYALLASDYGPTPVSSLKQGMLATIQFQLGKASSTPTASPTRTATRTASRTATRTSTSTPTRTASKTPTPSRTTTRTPTPMATGTATRTATSRATATRTSTRTATRTSTPTATATATALSCSVTYALTTDWGTGFQVSVAITNNGSSPIKGWKLTWNWVGNQQITESWNAIYSQSGKTATLSNAVWNASIAAGSSATGLGFNAGYSGTNQSPTSFFVNGRLCR